MSAFPETTWERKTFVTNHCDVVLPTDTGWKLR